MGFIKFFVFAICIFGLQAAKISQLEEEDEADAGQCPDGFTGLVPHPLFCPFYYLCDDGVPSLRECPSGLYFNPRTESCDLPTNVPECQGGTRPPEGTTGPTTTTTVTPETEPTISTGGPTTTTQPPPTTTTRPPTTTTTPPPGDLTCPPNPSVFMPYPGDCTRYYLCENGNLISIHTCFAEMWFRYSIQSCQTPWGGNCN